ncbi:Zn(2)-C6 fungal-type domain-containing protein [Fusarium keratoplasticum]|nr:Zn(2)-C6 fungal-type domain-containing protein [Fusarium keratoplasticum]
MARKGSPKVRTGCITCKARKVKCDEAKPECNRCVSTGRKCDGYLPQKQDKQRLWPKNQQLLANPTRTFPGIETRNEGRALQYFCDVAGPFLSGPADRYFWTHLVMQFANFEPAVRHSIVAISSLYEQLPSGLPQGTGAQDQRLILTHYNAAIRELKTMTAPEKQPLVLLVCILFICIEFLQSNDEAALKHCKHGITMLAQCGAGYEWTRQFLGPIFRRLSLFPFFFGRENSHYPSLHALSGSVPKSFQSFADARSLMDELFTRSVRIMRLGDDYRVGQLRHQPFPDSLYDEGMAVNSLLDTWDTLFTTFLSTDSACNTAIAERPSVIAQQSLLIRFDVCRIMAGMAVERQEGPYDRHLETFKNLAERLESLASSVPLVAKGGDARSIKFTFDMGFMPVMSFCTLKCRDLKTRLRFWRLMPTLACARESLWNLNLMTGLVRRVIEIEHKIRVDDDGQHTIPPSSEPLTESMRIRHLWADSMPTCRVIHGQTIIGRVAGFFLLDEDGNIHCRTEFFDDMDYNNG